MANRRIVNLAMTDYRNRMFSMHRMDLSKLLFYPSTAEAEAAGGHGLVDKGKAPKMGKLLLPPPIMGFQPFPTSSNPVPVLMSSYGSMFVLLHGPRGRNSSSEASRILFTSSAGQTSMYDVDSRSVISVPDITGPMRFAKTIPTATIAGADDGEEALYVMRARSEFGVLHFSSRDKSRRVAYSINDMTLKWQSLPPLPLNAGDISSFTVVGDGRIICVSAHQKFQAQDTVTFCFDTVSQEWWQVGDDWVLPFHGRVEYVPELETWLGFSSDHPHHLCAADLSGVATAQGQGPTLQHVWEDYNPPPMEESSLVLNKDYPDIVLSTTVEWKVSEHFLVNLGSGRFCVAKVVDCEKEELLSWSFEQRDPKQPVDELTVLSGVEVIRDGGDGELRMVKHKSRQLGGVWFPSQSSEVGS